MVIGILIMFAGYLQTIRPEPTPTPRLIEAERTQIAG